MNDAMTFTVCGSGYFSSLKKAMLGVFPTYVGGKKKFILIYQDLEKYSYFFVRASKWTEYVLVLVLGLGKKKAHWNSFRLSNNYLFVQKEKTTEQF